MIRKVLEYISNTGSTKVSQVIHGEPTSGSLGDYVLLKEYYRNNDPDWALTLSWKKRLALHIMFLKRRRKECGGNLTCVYCGKQNLKIKALNENIPKKIMVTVDHFFPKGKGGEAYNEDNMVVACSKCNGKKADEVWSTDTLVYMDEERKKIFVEKFG